MNQAKRQRLKGLILKRLDEPLSDKEYWYNSDKWSFLSSDSSLGYCRFDYFEEFDGTTEGLELPWTQKRKDLIDGGKAEPNQKELRQWRDAMARNWVSAGEYTHAAFIVSIQEIDKSEVDSGVALFLGDLEAAAEDTPWLEGIYDNIADAKLYLRKNGVIAKEK